MELKNRILYILVFSLATFMFADESNWCNLILQQKYSDNQLSHFTNVIQQAKNTNQKKQISESEYLYSYNGYQIYENISNLSGNASVDSEPTINFKIQLAQELIVMIHVAKKGTIVMQILNNNKRQLYMRYSNGKYSYSYYTNGNKIYSYDILEKK